MIVIVENMREFEHLRDSCLLNHTKDYTMHFEATQKFPASVYLEEFDDLNEIVKQRELNICSADCRFCTLPCYNRKTTIITYQQLVRQQKIERLCDGF